MTLYYDTQFETECLLVIIPGGFRILDDMTGEILKEWINGKVIGESILEWHARKFGYSLE